MTVISFMVSTKENNVSSEVLLSNTIICRFWSCGICNGFCFEKDHEVDATYVRENTLHLALEALMSSDQDI